MKINGFEEKGIIKVDNVRVYGLEESVIASSYPMKIETCDMGLIHELSENDLKRIKRLGSCRSGEGHDSALKGITVQFDLQVSEYIFRQLDRYHFIDHISSQSKMHRILKMDIDKACNKYVSVYLIKELKQRIDAYNNYEDFIEYIKSDGENEEAVVTMFDTFRDWYDYEEFSFDYNSDDDKVLYSLRNGEEIELTKENLFNIIIANCPCGIMLTSRMTTNYLQLKTIYKQRKTHKMQEHRLFCKWIESLPLMSEILGIDRE